MMAARIAHLTSRRPVGSTLLALFIWLLLSAAGVFAASVLLDRPIGDLVVQSAGSLFGIACLLALFWRLGWLGEAGISRLGGPRLWLLTLVAALYLILVYQFAFFGRFALSLEQISLPAGREILWRQTVVGFVEEVLFRGILLYLLVRAWGRAPRRLLAAVTVTAFLFGALHILQVLGGSEPWQAGLTMLNGLVSGLWVGALVLWGGSIWPAVLLHGLGNAVVQLPFVSGGVENLSAPGYALATLAELALVAVCWALLWRRPGKG